MSKSRRGKGNGMYGKHHSEETKQKLSKMFSKVWKITYPGGENLIVKGLNGFCKDNNLDTGHMIKVAKGKAKSHKGFKCEYYDED